MIGMNLSFGDVYSKEPDKKAPKKKDSSAFPVLRSSHLSFLCLLHQEAQFCIDSSPRACDVLQQVVRSVDRKPQVWEFPYFQYWVMHSRHRFCSWQRLLPIMRIRLTFSCCVSSWDWSLLEAGNTEIVGHNVCIIVYVYIYIYVLIVRSQNMWVQFGNTPRTPGLILASLPFLYLSKWIWLEHPSLRLLRISRISF